MIADQLSQIFNSLILVHDTCDLIPLHLTFQVDVGPPNLTLILNALF